MPFYQDIDASQPEGKRITERLLALRRQLDRDIPPRTFQRSLLLATWNIREFDSPAYGDRIPEAFYYIAEIVDRFDIIAIQEVRRNLKALYRLCEVLGGHWSYIVTDVTEGEPGNDERMAFLYDTRKVRFGGLASQLVLPPVTIKDEAGNKIHQPVTQLARTPFLGGFTSGWTRFLLATVHIVYGEGVANSPQRVQEIQQIAQFLRKRTLDEANWARNLILLGDFNIFKPTDMTMQALNEAGFIVPPELQHLPSNAPRSKFYDQIAFRVRPGSLDSTGQAGVFNFYETVFRPEDEAIYVPYMGARYNITSEGIPREDKSKYYLTYWRTFQMSDHLPMWVELKIDYSDDYLARKLAD